MYMSFLDVVVDKSGCFYSCFFWIIMERFRVNIFGKNVTPAQGELDKRIDPLHYLVLLPSFRV